MKRISTFIVFCLAASFIQNLSAQCTASDINPNPPLPFGVPIPVDAGHSFSSTNSTLDVFPKNVSTSLTSPDYYYTGNQPTIYFRYEFNITGVAGTTKISPSITITYGSPAQTISCNAADANVAAGTSYYYFSITPASIFPANTLFNIKLALAPAGKDITALSLATNAILAGQGGPTPLPVNLVSFSGVSQKTATELQWQVAANETAERFEIQRSVNGGSFTTVGVVHATQKSGDEQYRFSEMNVTDKVQYRLLMYDKNAKAQYSRILIFNQEATNKSALYVLTNPVRDKLSVRFTSKASERVQLNIYDPLGRTIQKQNWNVSEGINTLSVSLDGAYHSGLYFLEVVTSTGKLSEKILYSTQ